MKEPVFLGYNENGKLLFKEDIFNGNIYAYIEPPIKDNDNRIIYKLAKFEDNYFFTELSRIGEEHFKSKSIGQCFELATIEGYVIFEFESQKEFIEWSYSYLETKVLVN